MVIVVSGFYEGFESKFRIGSSKADCGGELVDIKRSILHPDWGKSNESIFDNDIMILELEKAVKFSDKVQPVELIGSNDTVRVGESNIVSGWGLTYKHLVNIPPPLQGAPVPILDRDECHKSLQMFANNNVTERMICAGFFEGGMILLKNDLLASFCLS